MKQLIVWVIVAVVLGVGGYFGWRWYEARARAAAITYRTAEAQVQTVTEAIPSTGTVVPEDVIDVGAQVNGQIASFGTDANGKQVDYRSDVVADSVLAKIDDTLYAADESSAEAALAQAQAQVKVAQASKDQAQARLDQSQRDWARAQKLGESRALSQADYDASKSAYEQAQAALTLSDAQINQGNAQVSIAQAALEHAKRNLFYCVIKSPVNGVIIDRRVDIGQTVVSSLNAPSLFLIAKDLKRMLVLVQVNEGDIGRVHPGQKVTFTTDAFPDDSFQGEVRKVRLNATMTQNVVTYTVEIVTDNSNLKLLPYLTAQVRFIVDQAPDALTVPNAALRFNPTHLPEGVQAPKGQHVWVLRDGQPSPAGVTPGITDGVVTVVESDELEKGDQVIVGESVPTDAAAGGTVNPFAAQPMRGGRGGGGAGGGGGGRQGGR